MVKSEDNNTGINEFGKSNQLEIYGAREHNLQNINVKIPRNKLVVITGVSGSGKSSLAFDTIYAEGQRRYMETFSAYARNFIGNIERPNVDEIIGLSPVISIEQKTTTHNPRSTVGTITEIYDFLRLLYARTATAYSPITNTPLIKYTEEQIINHIFETFDKKEVLILAPLVKGRKGHYGELFDKLYKLGYIKASIDGKFVDIKPKMLLDRYKTHDIELLIDKLTIKSTNNQRIITSIKTALQQGNGGILIIENESKTYFSKNLMDPSTGISIEEPEPNSFSFNSPYGACKNCNGLGKISDIDINKIFPDTNKSIKNGAIAPFGEIKDNWLFAQINAIISKYKYNVSTPIKDLSEEVINILLYGSNETIIVQKEFAGIKNTYQSDFKGIIHLLNEQLIFSYSKKAKSSVNKYMKFIECPICKGSRLKNESLLFKINKKNIADLSQMDILTLYNWLDNNNLFIDKKSKTIANEIIREIKTRLNFLLEVGLDYITLNRSTNTLSGGEVQRIRLATQIGSQLTSVLYILDEPSIGLHQRDNERLINALKNLRDLDNSVIVVEHDKEMMLSADYIIDIGPGAGKHGGNVVAQGTPENFKKINSLTSSYLNGTKEIKTPSHRRKGSGNNIELREAEGNNLKKVNAVFPLGVFICVTGVSGSGKSTLINDTLYPIISQNLYKSNAEPLKYKSISGLNYIDKIVEVNQDPIGRTPRSNPATYTGVFDEIRKLYSQLPEAKIRGYKTGRFSFNVKGGRCETCQGAGVKTIEMNFLPDVNVICETCNGKRYNKETLEVRYKGKSINDVLNMTINQAAEFFDKIPQIITKIKTLKDVGLGYITLGQQSTTLSGGESQRVKLATELSKKDTGKTLYILDEPTTGLHFEDVSILLNVLNKLVDKGNTIIVIEHNMDIIKMADFIIDLGPEGGDRGGEIMVQGTPEQIIKSKNSITGKYLKKEI